MIEIKRNKVSYSENLTNNQTICFYKNDYFLDSISYYYSNTNSYRKKQRAFLRKKSV